MSYNPEQDYSYEECFHAEHSDSRWLRYCPTEAVDENGDLGEVLDRLNEALYDDIPASEHDRMSCVTKDEHMQISRTYEQDYLPDDLASTLGYRIRTTISHTQQMKPDCSTYHVVAEWFVPSEDEVSESYWTEYCIEQFEGGSTLATITEFDATPERIGRLAEDVAPDHFFHDRPMTSYDHVQLHRLLLDIRALRLAKHGER